MCMYIYIYIYIYIYVHIIITIITMSMINICSSCSHSGLRLPTRAWASLSLDGSEAQPVRGCLRW